MSEKEIAITKLITNENLLVIETLLEYGWMTLEELFKVYYKHVNSLLTKKDYLDDHYPYYCDFTIQLFELFYDEISNNQADNILSLHLIKEKFNIEDFNTKNEESKNIKYINLLLNKGANLENHKDYILFVPPEIFFDYLSCNNLTFNEEEQLEHFISPFIGKRIRQWINESLSNSDDFIWKYLNKSVFRWLACHRFNNKKYITITLDDFINKNIEKTYIRLSLILAIIKNNQYKTPSINIQMEWLMNYIGISKFNILESTLIIVNSNKNMGKFPLDLKKYLHPTISMYYHYKFRKNKLPKMMAFIDSKKDLYKMTPLELQDTIDSMQEIYEEIVLVDLEQKM